MTFMLSSYITPLYLEWVGSPQSYPSLFNHFWEIAKGVAPFLYQSFIAAFASMFRGNKGKPNQYYHMGI